MGGGGELFNVCGHLMHLRDLPQSLIMCFPRSCSKSTHVYLIASTDSEEEKKEEKETLVRFEVVT